MTMRVVLDTNCLVSALLFSRANFAWLRIAWQSGQITPLLCKETASEFIRVLNYPKFKLTPAVQQLLLAEILPYAEAIQAFHVPENLPKCRDANDQIFISLAVACNAFALVTGDEYLLSLSQEMTAIKIMTASAFKEWLLTHVSASA